MPSIPGNFQLAISHLFLEGALAGGPPGGLLTPSNYLETHSRSFQTRLPFNILQESKKKPARRPPTRPLNSGQCSENSVQRPLQTVFGPDHGLKHAGGTLCHALKWGGGGGADDAAPTFHAVDDATPPNRVSDRGLKRTLNTVF